MYLKISILWNLEKKTNTQGSSAQCAQSPGCKLHSTKPRRRQFSETLPDFLQACGGTMEGIPAAIRTSGPLLRSQWQPGVNTRRAEAVPTAS